MEIRKFVDSFGDDAYALALIVTKSFDSAKKIFAKTALDCGKYADGGLFPIAADVWAECRESESNDEAVTLTGLELPAKLESLLKEVLMKPQILRGIIHLYYENDLDEKQIAKVTGESEKYIVGQLSKLPAELAEALDKHYKELCAKIHAEDKLKAYVIKASDTGDRRMFEVKEAAVPIHRWTKKQKTIVIIIAAIITILVCIVIPIADAYIEMIKAEREMDFEEPATDEIFSYTYEPDES
ncbi:MAG: hypothetical protein K2G32_11585 [Oscillospiraceae bacterium]|nr:hypothetical protein [Oscillospiraceae bacterium]